MLFLTGNAPTDRGELRDRGLRMPEERDIKLTGIHFDEDPVEGERKEAKVHHLTCENVGYRYRGAKKATLKSVNLALKTGEVVALAGSGGQMQKACVAGGLIFRRNRWLCWMN